MEELDATINSLNIDNKIKTEAKEAIVAGYFAALNQTLQSTIESQSKVTLNERQKSVLDETIKDIKSIVSNRDMTEEKKRQEISQRIEGNFYIGKDWEKIKRNTLIAARLE